MKDSLKLICNYCFNDLELNRIEAACLPKNLEGINLRDTQRVSRAISVYKHTGVSLSEWYKKATCI